MNVETIEQAIREEGGLTAVASRMGVKPNTLRNWITRGRVPGEHVEDLCLALRNKVLPHGVAPRIFRNPTYRAFRPRPEARP